MSKANRDARRLTEKADRQAQKDRQMKKPDGTSAYAKKIRTKGRFAWMGQNAEGEEQQPPPPPKDWTPKTSYQSPALVTLPSGRKAWITSSGCDLKFVG
ncbi:MAG: hypothetical protein A2664_04785 [Candidatus Taylorbacteria bacterium RIFCSPHIGHO2_01_FULL_46_22b]|uniref:Uncharacterized protein n=1 Tax=Candidatus Taylorbacteria bacterium RIFCSPHIGHO2_01_FULL_46_22b TaxID=1802301 RepID=A0A1G2M4Q6_9BACT|nr:MAG: hypothetical protein A2664_04785 [Candidatus Taylorbacteria bacterium RIFCSPHIGHO2_01_FULL_46_22b]